MKNSKAHIILILAFMVILGVAGINAPSADAHEYPVNGGGSTDGDNWVRNGRFESGDTNYWTKLSGSTGSMSVTSTRKYEGSSSLLIKDTIAVGGFAWFWANQDIGPMPIGTHTKIGAAIYLDSDATRRLAGVMVHITPGDYWLVYYVSDNYKVVNIENVQYGFKIGDEQNKWHHFYSRIQGDIRSVDKDPQGQSIDKIQLVVKTESWWWQSCDAFFDQIYLGSTPPSISLTSHSDGDWVRDVVTFSGTAVDNRGQGFDGVYYIVNPSEWQLTVPGFSWTKGSSSTSWSIQVDTNDLSNGANTIYFWARDVTGSTTRVSLQFNVDNLDPILSVTSPVESTWVGGTIVVEGTAEDAHSGISHVRGRIGTQPWVTATGTTTWTLDIDTTAVDDGSQLLTVVAYDNTGNADVESFFIYVDNTAPEINTVSMTPTYGSDDTTFTLTASISETGSGMASCSAIITRPDGTDFELVLMEYPGSSATMRRYEATFTLGATHAEGEYKLKSIYVSDNVGNSHTGLYTDVKVIFDRTPPTLLVSSHANDDVVSGTSIEFSGVVDDPLSGIASLTVSIDGGDPIDITYSNGAWAFNWATSDYSDGYHVFRFKCIDKAGNTRIVYRYIVLRNQAEFVIPYVPAINQYGEYIGYSRVTAGDVQLVILYNVGPMDAGTIVSLLIPSPMIDSWRYHDFSYVQGDDTFSIGTSSEIIWNPENNRMSFPVVFDGGVDIRGKSVIISILKEELNWYLDPSSSMMIEEGVMHSLTFSVRNSYGSLPQVLPFDVELQVVQNGRRVTVAQAQVDSNGEVTFSFTLDVSHGLVAGSFSVIISITEDLDVLQDVSTTVSDPFSDFIYWRIVTWTFNPDEDEIAHYSAVFYDQRPFTATVVMRDSDGSAAPLIGQAIDITIIGPTSTETLTIYQTEHEDGIYAELVFSPTEVGHYQIVFDHVQIGYYLYVEPHIISLIMSDQRPVSVDLKSPGITVQGSILLSCNVTDDWAGNYPVSGIVVAFTYEFEGEIYVLGNAVTDGFGSAHIYWSLSEDEWLTLAGAEIQLYAHSTETSTYLANDDCLSTNISKVATHFLHPLVNTDTIDAGDDVSIVVQLVNQFGTQLEKEVILILEGPHGFYQEYIVQTGPDSGFEAPLPLYGIYTVTIVFEGDAIYTPIIASDEITVNGIRTLIVISPHTELEAFFVDEPISVSFDLFDYYSTKVDNGVMRVTIDYGTYLESFDLIEGLNDTLQLVFSTSGLIFIRCEYDGDHIFEASQSGITLAIQGRPVTVVLEDIPPMVHPYVFPSQIEYDLTAMVTDSIDGTALNNISVVFCYVTESDIAIYLTMNQTDHLNTSQVYEYLAWGVFHEIGVGITDLDGVASILWQVNTIPEQTITVFAITLHTPILSTGVSSPLQTEVDLIDTEVFVESDWSGDGTNVEFTVFLYDEFGYRLFDKPVQINVTGPIGIFDYSATFVVVTGFNDSIIVNLPEYGLYEIYAIFHGDEAYNPSKLFADTFTVSWRMLEINLTGPSCITVGEPIQFEILVLDLNATANEWLQETVTVHLAYITTTGIHEIASSIVNEGGYTQIIWTPELFQDSYHFVAFTTRSLIYDAAMSEILYIEIIPLDTNLIVSVEKHLEFPFNLTYNFEVILEDTSGNSLDGEVVELVVTTNYTEFWNGTIFDPDAQLDCAGSHCIQNHQVFRFVVIIGFNSSFSWQVPGHVVDVILFSARAIAIAEYPGNLKFLPAIDSAKLGSRLIETDTKIWIEGNPESVFAGVPVTIHIIVTDEDGFVLKHGRVNLAIYGPDGLTAYFQVDLMHVSSIVWTPPSSGRFSIRAEFLGGEHPRQLAHRAGCSGVASHYRWRLSYIYNMRLTRSYDILNIRASRVKVGIALDELPLNVHIGTLVILRGFVYNLETSAAIAGYPVSFFYIDELGKHHFIGVNSSNAAGISFFAWDLSGLSRPVGYYTYHVFVSGQDATSEFLEKYSDHPIKIWPEQPPQTPPDGFISDSHLAYRPVHNSPADELVGMALASLFMFISLTTVHRVRPDVFKRFMIILMLFFTVGLLYVGLALESFNYPFAMDLVSDVSVAFDGMKDDPAVATAQTSPINLPSIVEPYASRISGINTGTSLDKRIYSTSDENPTEAQSIVTTSPNASYVVVPLQKSLNINFTASGRYIVSVVDETRKPVDTLAGYASGPVNVSFLITPDKYEPGSSYSVNIFVTVERFGIIYADTSWVVMFVSRTATYVNLLLQREGIPYDSVDVDVPIAARLTQMHDNISIAGVELEFYYRSAYDLIWHSIGSRITDKNGFAALTWHPIAAKGDYVINVTFSGTDILDGATSANVFSITGAKSVLTYAPGSPTTVSVQYAHTFEIASQLKSYQNIPLPDKTVHYYLVDDDVEYWIGSCSTDHDGIAKFEYVPYLQSGIYDLVAKFEGDEDYAPSHHYISEGLEVLRRLCIFDGELKIDAASGDKITISLPVSDEIGNAITEKTVRLQIYRPSTGRWVTLARSETDMAGHARFDYTVDLESGVHPIRITLMGDGTTQETAIQGTIKVAPRATNIICVPVDARYGEEVVVSANLEDGDGTPIQGATILFYLEEGSRWAFIGHAQTGLNGWADMSWVVTHPTSAYRIKALYPGSDQYASSECIVSDVLIEQVESKLLVSVNDKAHITQTTLFEATLLGANDIPLAARPVRYHIESDSGQSWSCTLITDDTGYTSLEFVPPYLGWFTITVSFEGDGYCLPSSYTNDFEAIKIGAVVMLSVSQTSAHRGDTLYFSGLVTYYDQNTEEYVPVESGVTFELVLLSDSDASLGPAVQIVTGTNGKLEGYWTIPRYTSPEVPYLFLAQEYSFRIQIINSVYTGSADFTLDMILRTSLTVMPVFPTVNGALLDTVYVDMPMDYEFGVVDEDGNALVGVETKTRFNNDDWLYYSTDQNGAWVYRNSIMDTAGAIRVLGKYDGSRFLDSAAAEIEFVAYRRPLAVSMVLGSYYLRRNDACSISLTATDTVWNAPLVGENIPVKILLDGRYVKTAYLSEGICETEVLLPEELQAGMHLVEIIIEQSRVYSAGTNEVSFDAYEYASLKLHTTNSAKTEDHVEIRLTLYDEDGSPLSDRFVTLDIQNTDGSFTSFILKTDSIGRTATLWEPKDVGSYSLKAEYDGEYLFVGNNDGPYSVEVESGDAKNEAGPSPLWLLPIILAMIANVIIESTTFGVLAYIDVTTRKGDGYMHISKYSYPWVEIHYVEVSLPLGGTITVPIPVIVVRSGFSFTMTQGDQIISFTDGDNEGFSSNLNGGDLFDGFLSMLDEVDPGMESEAESTPSSPEQVPSYLRLPSSTPESHYSSTGKLAVEILSPDNKATVRGRTNVTAKVTGAPSSDVKRVVMLVGGEVVSEMTHQGGNVYYHDWNTNEKSSGLPKFRNGYDWLEVKVELTNGSEATDKNVVNIFNTDAFWIGVGLVCAGAALVFLIGLLINRIADVVFAGAEANTPLRILRNLLTSLFIMILTFRGMLFIFEIITQFGAGGWYGGILISIVMIVLGILLLHFKGSDYKTRTKVVPRAIIGVALGARYILGGIMDSHFGGGMDGWASPLISIMSGVALAAMTAGVMKQAYQKTSVFKKFTNSIRWQSYGIGVFSAGMLILYKTVRNSFLLFSPKNK